jgi:lysine 2,3-aminomutase
VAYMTRIEDLPQLKEEEKHALSMVTDKFAFRSNEYYNSLINWEDPNDPLRKIVIPRDCALGYGQSHRRNRR